MQKSEYQVMVDRVRKFYGPAVEIGGFNSHDIIKLQKRAAEADRNEADERARRPLSEAGTRLHHTRERAHRAWRVISDGQATLAKNRRLHVINGVADQLLIPVDMPVWSEGHCATVEDYDAANNEAAHVATEMEGLASKLTSYVSEWERSTREEQNRSLILALAARLDRIEQTRTQPGTGEA